MTKICTKCHREYPATLEYFSPYKQAKDKLHSWCRVCHRKGNRECYQKYRNAYLRTAKKYRQSNKGKIIIQRYNKTINGHLRRIYSDIKNRCTNPKNAGYKYYGGRGIKLKFTSDEFIDYVINILKIDPRKLQIDRINNNGHYEKDNIRFVTAEENLKNRRKK